MNLNNNLVLTVFCDCSLFFTCHFSKFSYNCFHNSFEKTWCFEEYIFPLDLKKYMKIVKSILQVFNLAEIE